MRAIGAPQSFLFAARLTLLLPVGIAGTREPTEAVALTPAPADSATVAWRVDSLLRARTADDTFSGSVLVARNGKLFLRRGYGMANREQSVANDATTRYRIASLTKSFTALAILQLEARGALSTTDPVSRFIPGWPRGDEISIHQVVTHTAGLPDFLDLPEYWQRVNAGPTTTEEAVNLIRNRPLVFEPGSSWSYSNAGYLMLGLIIERASGMSYEQFLRTQILDPLGMTATQLEVTAPIESVGATGYSGRPLAREVVPQLNMTVNSSAGSLYSNIDDLYRWDRALYGDRLLPAPLMKKLFTPVRNFYGYGWGMVTISRVGKRAIFMNGRFGGFTATIHRFPDDDACIIILANQEDLDPLPLTYDIAGIVFADRHEQ